MSSIKIVKASAGSGKTYRLAYEYVRRIVAEPSLYKNILAVTFTNKATKEMKSRILEEVDAIIRREGFFDTLIEALRSEQGWEGLSPEALSTRVVANATLAQRNILQDYSNFSVMTIDRFFQKIYRAFCNELGIDSSFDIKLDIDYFLQLAIDAIVVRYQQDEELKQLVEGYLQERMDNNNSYRFQNDLLPITKYIFTKEFDVRYFIDNYKEVGEFFESTKSDFDELRTAFVRASKALLSTIDSLGLSATDFYQGSRGLVPLLWKWSSGELVVPNSYVKRMLDIDSKWGKEAAEDAKYALHPALEQLCGSINMQLTLQIILDRYYELMMMVHVAKELDEVLKSNNTILLASSLKVITALVNNNTIPYIFEKIGNKYTVLMIDEFQDTSMEQWQNFVPLVDNILSQSSSESVLFVGDLKQSIYAWRGGDWRILEYEVASSIQSGHQLDYDTLGTNWRSHKNIITFNNLIIRSCANMLESSINSMLESEWLSAEFRRRFEALPSRIYEQMEQQVSPRRMDSGGYAEYFQYDTTEDGVSENLIHTVEVIEDLQQRGYSPSDIVILVRAKGDIAKITNYISHYIGQGSAKSGVSYELVSRDGLLLKYSPFVNFVLSCYKIALDNQDTLSISIFNNYLGLGVADRLSAEHIVFVNSLSRVSICESFELILKYFGERATDELAYVQALQDKIINFSRNTISDISHLLEMWENEKERWSVTTSPRQDCISIETIHAVKGLEYRVVIVPFCDWRLEGQSKPIWLDMPQGEVPYAILSTRNELMEHTKFAENCIEHRIMESVESFNIFYVALTRAEQELYIMAAKPPTGRAKVSLRGMIAAAFSQRDDEVLINYSDEMIGYKEQNCYCFGRKMQIEQTVAAAATDEMLTQYNSIDFVDRVQFFCANERYFDAPTDEPTARELGILKHQVFEKIEYSADAQKVLSTMYVNGDINSEQYAQLKGDIEQLLTDSVISRWFESDWQVRNENNILLYDSHYNVYRPDRVVTRNQEAIVVDYKFGAKHNYHNRQVSRYMELLSQMGYRNVQGFIWYLTTGQVVEL